MLRSLYSLVALLLLCDLSAYAQRRDPPPKPRSAAMVNGHPVPFDAYEQAYNDNVRQQAALATDGVLNQALDDQIILGMINEELIRQEAAKYKIAVTRADARRAMLKDPPDFMRDSFVDSNGVFRRETFEALIDNPKLVAQLAPPGKADEMVAQWINDIEKVILYVQQSETRRLLGEKMMKEKPLTDAMIRGRYFAEKTEFNGSFIRVLHSTVPDTLTPVTKGEAKKWYETHIEDYRFPAQAQVGALIIPVEPSSEDSMRQSSSLNAARTAITSASPGERSRLVQEQLRGLPPNRFPDSAISILQVPDEIRDNLKNAAAGDLIGPITVNEESVLFYIEKVAPRKDTALRASHIMIKIESDDLAADTVARDFAEQLREKVGTDAEFTEAAQMFSQDASKSRGGDLGYFGRGTMVRNFEQASFPAAIGTVIGPIRTQFGYHLIKVTERVTTGYRITEMRFPLSASPAAREIAMRDAMLYADALRSKRPDTDSLYRAIRMKYLRSVSDTSVLKRLDLYGDVLGTVNFAFNAKVGETVVMPLPFDRIMVAELLGSWPSGVAPYDKILYNFVMPHVQRTKQLDLLKPTMLALRDTMTATLPLGLVRMSAPMSEAFMIRKQILPSPPDEEPSILDSLVERTGNGRISGPVRGTHAYYFLRVEEKLNAPTAADFKREQKEFSKEYRARYLTKMIDDRLAKARQYAVVEDLRPSARMIEGGQ